MRLIYYIFILFTCLFLQSCDLGYKTEEGKVYYYTWNEGSGSNRYLIKDADIKTFKALENSNYAKDKNYGYFEGDKIKGIYSQSFQSINDYYAKDNLHAYYENKIIGGALGKHFEVIKEGPYSKDGKNYFYKNISLNISDYKTVKILDNLTIIDRFHIYIQSDINSDSSFTKKFPLNDYDSFELLKEGYSKDNKRVYFKGEIIELANPKTFEILDYAKGKDDKNIFYGTCKIENPNTLIDLYGIYMKDNLAVYYNNRKIIGANPKSFEIIYEEWSKDDKNVFFEGKKMKNIDCESFEQVKGYFVKDYSKVFYKDSLIINAHPKTIKTFDNWDFIRDDKAIFFHAKKIEKADLKTFRTLENEYAIDKNYVYFHHKKLNGVDVKTFITTEQTFGGKDRYGEIYMGNRE